MTLLSAESNYKGLCPDIPGIALYLYLAVKYQQQASMHEFTATTAKPANTIVAKI